MATKYWKGTTDSFNTASNWSDGVAPANGDTLIFDGRASLACLTNLSTTLTGLTIIVEKSFTKTLGAVTAGVCTYLVIDGGTLKMPKLSGGAEGTGSACVAIDFGSTAGTVVIEDTSTTGSETYNPPVRIAGTSLTATVTGGIVGFGVSGESVTLASLRTGRGPGNAPDVFLGAGVTITDAVLDYGDVDDRRDNTATAIRVSGATYNYTGTGATTTLNVDDGTVYYSGTGTITTCNLRKKLDFSRDGRAKTVTTLNTYRGYELNVDNGVPGGITFTNAINHYDGINAGTITTPANVKGTLLSI